MRPQPPPIYPPSVASFTSCSLPIWVSPPARWEWQLASVSMAPLRSMLSAVATHHPSLLPMTAQGTSSRPSPCYRWVSPFCIAVTQKMTAVMTAVLTPALPKHLFSLQVFCLPQAFCKPCGNGEIRQKQGRAGSSVLNPKAGCPLLTAPSEPHHHVQRRLQTRAELPAL